MKRTSFVLSIALLTIVMFGAAAQTGLRKPITVEDLWSIGRVADPQLSPNGEWALFVVTYFSMDENTSNSDIYLVKSSGGTAQQITTSAKMDAHPRWSPDGKTIAFISARDGAPHVWLMDADGNNQRKLTTLSTGAGGVEWSPTGTHLLFTSDVYPDCNTDDCNRARNDEKEASKVKARVFEKLPIRVWDHWRDGTYSHLFVVPTTGGEPKDVTPGEFDVPPIDLTGDVDYAVSPDGTEIAFVRNTEKNVMTNTNNDVWLCGIDGSNARCISSDNKANDNQPVFSPDGKYLAYRAMARPGFEADRYHLMLFDRTKKMYRDLTRDVDRSVGEVFWSPDSKKIYFTAEESGYNSLFEIPIDGGDILRVLKGTFDAQYKGDPNTVRLGMYRSRFSIGADGQTLLFLGQRANYPPEVIRATYEGNTVSKFVQVSDVNTALVKTLEMNVAESFTFKGDGGMQVQGWIVKPPFFDPLKKYPLVFLVHGGPQGAWADNFHFRWNYQMFAAPGYVVVAINPRGSTGFGQKFTDEISGDWGGKVYKDLMLGLDYVLKAYPFIDAKKLVAAGGSYGGYMMNWMLGHTNRFKALVSHSGVYNLESMYGTTEELWFPEWEYKGPPWTSPQQYAKWSPHKYAKNFKTPTLITHGERDFRVPITEGLQLFTTLQRLGVPSKLVWFPDETHFITKPQNARLWWGSIHDWFGRWLK